MGKGIFTGMYGTAETKMRHMRELKDQAKLIEARIVVLTEKIIVAPFDNDMNLLSERYSLRIKLNTIKYKLDNLENNRPVLGHALEICVPLTANK